MATITFGKYSGKTTEELKSIDPEYLRWGARELRSQYWRSEFAKASTTITRLDEARAIAKDGDVCVSEAMDYLNEVQRHEDEMAAQMATAAAAELEVLKKWAPIMGKSVAQLRSIRNSYRTDWNEVPARMFSSVEMHRNFCAMMLEVEAASEAAFKATIGA